MDKFNARKGLALGTGKAQDTEIEVNNGAANKPKVKWNETTQKWQFSNDGVTFDDFGSGGTWGDITGTLSEQTDLQSALDNKENTANKNQANGYVGLDANGKVDITHLPPTAIERVITVSDETSRFALTTNEAQNGDVVRQIDTEIMYFVVDDTNLNNSTGYLEFSVGVAGAVEWSNILNKPIDIFYTGINTTDDITEGTTNLFDKEVVFTGGNNVTITGTYPSFEIQDNTTSSIDIQNALDTKLNSADNLTDVADQQIALNNITAVSGATNEHVLTKDTATGNAQWKEIVSSDELIKVSANDATAGYLEDKIVGTTNKITVTTLDDSSNEDLQIDIGTDIFDKSINTMDDIVDGTIYVKTENNLTDTLKTNYDSAYTHSTTTTGNPHNVTKTDVGLENVVNVDTTNPANITWTESYRTVTDTEKTTWNGKVNSSDVVTTATANKILKLDANAKLPANITGNADGNSATATKLQTVRTINGVSFDGSADITINAVDTTSRIASTEKGSVNGVATLDNAGKVPSSQLPSYVDDVLEYATYAGFPATGESGKIYVALNTNLAYRWGGSNYVEISPSIALGEASETAYRGDRGKIAYDHSQLTGGTNPHNTTFANIASKPTSLSGYGITDGVTLTGTQTLTNKTISSPVITGTPTGITATHIGLGNVTNNAQVKKIASSTDNAIMRFDGTTGDLPQNSLATISDTGTVNIPTGQYYNINGVALKDVSETLTNKTLTSPILNTEVTGTAVTTTGEANKLVKIDSSGDIILSRGKDLFFGSKSTINVGAGAYGRVGAINTQGVNTVPYILFGTTGNDDEGYISFFNNAAERLSIKYNGVVKIASLSGTGTRMVVADSSGNLKSDDCCLNLTTGNNASIKISKNISLANNVFSDLFNFYSSGGFQSATYIGAITGELRIKILGLTSSYEIVDSYRTFYISARQQGLQNITITNIATKDTFDNNRIPAVTVREKSGSTNTSSKIELSVTFSDFLECNVIAEIECLSTSNLSNNLIKVK